MDTNEIDISQRVERARALHHSGCNCAQAVVMAYQDLIDLDSDKAMAMAAPFGRGLSGLREVCGCVSGMAMVGGLTGNAPQVRAMAQQFQAENGDLNCGRLLQQGKRPCNELVACAARILGETLKGQQQNL